MSPSEGWSEQARRTAAGVMRTHHLRPAARAALAKLLLDFYSGVDEAAFWKRWRAIDLGPADGLTHLAVLADAYFRQLVRSEVVRDTPETLGVGEILALVAVYLGELEGKERFGPADLPIPASSAHDHPDHLPIPVKKP